MVVVDAIKNIGRKIVGAIIVIAILYIIWSWISGDPAGAGHQVGGWISGFFHALHQIGVFIRNL